MLESEFVDSIAASGPAARVRAPLRHLRWYICGLLFFATTINYIDRQVLGILKPVLERELGWRESQFGWVVFGFTLAYALMMPVAGRLIDWMGTRIGYVLAVLVWSAAAMSHSLARTAVQFGMARFFLGVGESANFPAAIKTVADWFPPNERALATGIFNSGSNVGAIVAPLAVPWLVALFGWRVAFLGTGTLVLVWVVLWLWLYHPPGEHPRLGPEERALVMKGRAEEEACARIPYTELLKQRAAWAFLIGKFLTDPVWWFYLYWLPGFLNSKYQLDLMHLGPPLIVVYVSADVGSIGGGWLSSWLLGMGWPLNRARKAAMLVCALAVTAVIFVMRAGGNLWLAVALVSTAAAAHQGWSANLFTLVSDTFPRRAVGSVVGLGGLGGAVGGMLVAPSVGYWLDFSHGSYGPLFVIAGLMYLTALGIIQALVPRLEQAALAKK